MASGLVARGEREYHQALALFDAAIAYLEGSGVGKAPPIVSYQKAATLLRLGEIDRSEALLRDTLTEALAQGEKYGASACLGELGLIALLRSNPKQALAEFHHALALASELAQVLEMSYWLMALAAVAGMQGRRERVVSLLGTASTLCNRSGIPLNIPEYLKPRALAGALDIPRLLARTRASLPEPAFDDAWQAGVARSVADVVLNPFHTAKDSRTVYRARKVRRVDA